MAYIQNEWRIHRCYPNAKKKIKTENNSSFLTIESNRNKLSNFADKIEIEYGKNYIRKSN